MNLILSVESSESELSLDELVTVSNSNSTGKVQQMEIETNWTECFKLRYLEARVFFAPLKRYGYLTILAQ